MSALAVSASRKRGPGAGEDDAAQENGSSTSPQPLKRQRLSSESEEQVRAGRDATGKQQHRFFRWATMDLDTPGTPSQVLFRHSKRVERPGIPNPICLSLYRLPDKPSPPLRGDDKVRARVRACKGAPGFFGRRRRCCTALAVAHSRNPQHHTHRRGTMCTSWGRTSAVDVSRKAGTLAVVHAPTAGGRGGRNPWLHRMLASHA
jgi:hypothetical protein